MVAATFFRIPEFMQRELNAGRQQCFPADLVASPPLPRIYCHHPSGTKGGKDRYRDCRQHNFSYREYRTLRSPRIYYVFRRCVLVLVGMWVSRVGLLPRSVRATSVHGNDARSCLSRLLRRWRVWVRKNNVVPRKVHRSIPPLVNLVTIVMKTVRPLHTNLHPLRLLTTLLTARPNPLETKVTDCQIRTVSGCKAGPYMSGPFNRIRFDAEAI